ncbi:MAG: TetR/AcrR family transcriptional regulator C-terminal domain-containing protein [Acidimicrobiales bacterium]
MASGNSPKRRTGADTPTATSRATSRASANVAAKAAKLSAKAAKHAEVAEHLSRAAEHVAAHARRHDERGGGDLRSAMAVWLRTEPGTRRPRFTRDDIAAAALHIADTEGLDGLSMRRLALELDAGTMTLYHYVRTKDELLALLADAILGEVALPDDEQLPADWRQAMTVIARRTKETLDRHPWVLDVRDDPDFGPNGVRHFDQSLDAASRFGGTLEEQLDLLFAVDEYVFGYCLQHRVNSAGANGAAAARSAAASGASVADELDRHLTEYLERLIHTRALPALQRLAEAHGVQGAWRKVSSYAQDEGRFERNLQRLLDGFEARRRHR